MTRQFKKLSHSVYECKYHVVFCPKYRYKILEEEVRTYVIQQAYRLCNQKEGVEILVSRPDICLHSDNTKGVKQQDGRNHNQAV